MPQLVIYEGKKTAFYNDRSYWPGQIFEVPDEIPEKDSAGRPKVDAKGNPVMKKLIIGPYSKLRLLTEEEAADYRRKHPVLDGTQREAPSKRPFRGSSRGDRASNPLRGENAL